MRAYTLLSPNGTLMRNGMRIILSTVTRTGTRYIVKIRCEFEGIAR